MLVPLILFE
ncbi:hypothetical protein AAFF_G00352000 [Aldrovandia affinis]|uniref:Uncharacterized protein n=1 Tax=Aldrovandia affinis TaxID=143900 RepID=A0AAD7SJI8_9TELE|nr:hypothetical protein AAFF_G00352000 [Aldrovandia affinis]